MKSLEASNWNSNGSDFHIFNSQDELICYLLRSTEGNWWREEYGRYDFEQCLFKFEVKQWIGDFEKPVCFENATFIKPVTFEGLKFKQNAEFGGCTFNRHVNFSNTTFFKSFSPCSFDSSVNFSGATFKEAIIFWRKRFHGVANFRATKFEKSIDFDESKFESEFIFHDSIIQGDVNFQHVEFLGKVNAWKIECAGNISFKWADFRDKANFSELSAETGNVCLHGTNFEQNAYFYGSKVKELNLRKSVIEKGIYFLDAKIDKANRETWRIIKNEFIKQNNRIESIKYHSLEMNEYEKELFDNKKLVKLSTLRFIRDFLLVFKKGNRTDKFIVFINRISNGNNDKPFRGIVFTLISTLIFYLIFLVILKIENNISFNYSFKYLGINFKQILQLLNITNWDYTPFNLTYNWAYSILVIGRIVIGFGIYQTVQAFRKFGRL